MALVNHRNVTMKRFIAILTIAALITGNVSNQVLAQAATPTAQPTVQQSQEEMCKGLSEASLRIRKIHFLDCQNLVGEGGGAVNGSGGSCTDLSVPTILDKARLAATINEHILSINPTSPMAGLGMDIIEGAVRGDVNPLLVVVQAQKESQFGYPDGVAGIPNLNNAFGRRAGGTQPAIEGWFKYDSWQKSVNDPDNPEYDQPKYMRWLASQAGNATLETYMNAYAPPVENDTTLYIKQIREWMGEIAAKAGNALSCGSGSADGNKIAQIAAGEVGNAESSYNCGDTIQKYFDHSNVGCGLAWCAFFITWVYAQAGLEIASSNNGYVPAVGVWFLESKFFFYRDDPYTPQPGDIYIKVNSGSSDVPMTMAYGDHIGIVERVEGSTLYTIDGNYGDMVQRRTFENYAAADSPIIGFGRFVDKGSVQPDGGAITSGGGASNGGGLSEQ